jgi:AraC family ethanolamine operon transcriptional activator
MPREQQRRKSSTSKEPWPAGTQLAQFTVVQLDTTDADEQATSLPLWNRTFDQLTPGPFAGKLIQIQFAGIQIFREITNQLVHETGRPWEGSRTFSVPLTMDGEAFYRGKMIGHRTLLTLGDNDELSFRRARSLDIVNISVNADALAEYALDVGHRNIKSEFASVRVIPISPDSALDLGQFLVTVLESIAANPQVLRYPELQRGLEHAIFGGLISRIRNGEKFYQAMNQDALEAERCLMSRCKVAKRAMHYMQAHVQEAISLSDISSAINVSPRTLEYSFKEVMGVKPVSYLRAWRLNQVRRELKRENRKGVSVANAAARWGFWHLSRFASDYKRMFGELPSETLRRSSRRRD